jgi:3-oxoacyl-[acyl-carrier protein] reductase
MANKSILVTGGSRGIGKAIASKFAKNGYDVAITYSRNRVEAEQTIIELAGFGIKSVSIQCDFSADNSIDIMFKEYDKHFEHLDVLVNNAGWTNYIDFDQISDELFNKLIAINLKSVFYSMKYGLERMNSNEHNIINVASIAAYNGMGSNMIYCAAKAGVVSLTKSFARVAGETVRVNSIAPGLTETDMTLEAPDSYLDLQRSSTPLNRLARPEDIGDVAYAIVNDMKFVNGRTIIVDGGSLL